MAELFEFANIRKKYEGFFDPISLIEIEGRDVAKAGFAVSGVEASLTCGFAASVATFYLADVFSRQESKYRVGDLKKIVQLGKSVKISLGYGNTLREVFFGFISQVAFTYDEGDMPMVRVTCMDIKGVMMQGNFNKQLTAKDYSGAVKEIFDKTSIKTLVGDDLFQLYVTDTPDHKESSPAGGGGAGGGGATTGGAAAGGAGSGADANPFSVEMVNETDYEFVVRAAKRFNYEFFCVGPMIFFRKAREVQDILAKISPEWIIRHFDLEYNITGLLGEIQVRGVNPDKGEVIMDKRKLSQKISTGSKAKALIKDASYILQDPTLTSKEDAKYRLDYLENEFSNRFARLNIEINGTPEFVPGYFIEIDRLTSELSKKFYVRTVTHLMRHETGYSTIIEATAPTMNDWS